MDNIDNSNSTDSNNNGNGNKGYHATGYSTIMAQELGHTVTDA